MKRATIIRVGFLFTLCVLLSEILQAQQTLGPFGLHRGMSRAEVFAIIGRDAVMKDTPNALEGSMVTVSTVPKPFREFEMYQLLFSRTDGLLKIVAIGKDVDTAADGEELRSHFDEMKGLLTNIYGTPHVLDFVKSSDNESLKDPGYFMLGLVQKERNLSCYWEQKTGASLKDQLRGIVLEANALHTDRGYIGLSYEFIGWDEYVDRLKATEGNVL